MANPRVHPTSSQDWPQQLDMKEESQTMYDVITKLNLWSKMNDPHKKTWYSKSPSHKIANHPDILKENHSGASFNYLVNRMKSIVLKGGWAAFCASFERNEQAVEDTQILRNNNEDKNSLSR